MITDIGEAIRDILIKNSTVAGLVGSRVYPVLLPQRPVFPAVTYQRISGTSDMALTGATGLSHPRFQVDVWSATYSATQALADAVREALNNYSGTVGSVVIGSVVLQAERDQYETDPVALFRVIMDFNIWHKE